MTPRHVASALAVLVALLPLRAAWPAWSEIEIRPSPESLPLWKSQPRAWSSIHVRINHGPWSAARARVKGRTGSFQPADARPSLTLLFDAPQTHFDHARRVHLENGAEDPAHLHSAWGAEAFRMVGIPCPRVGWGRVTLGARSLGWYGVREGIDPSFLHHAWAGTPSAVGEPATGSDLGDAIDWKADSDAATATQADRTWETLGQHLREGWTSAATCGVDHEQFLTFVATEILIGHRDGYALARNNYRVAMTRNGLQFIPWGMDQLLQSPTLTVWPQCAGNLARALLSEEASRSLWAQKLQELSPRVLDARAFRAWTARQSSQLRPHLTRAESGIWDQHVHELEAAMIARERHVASELSRGVPRLRPTTTHPAIPSTWTAVGIPEDGHALESTEPDGTRAWMLVAGKQTSAAWTAPVQLPPGHYRFEGRIRTQGVQRLSFGSHHGAALRIGGIDARSASAEGDTSWQTVAAEFNIASTNTSVSLICELRARSGRAWFDRDSLKLFRIE